MNHWTVSASNIESLMLTESNEFHFLWRFMRASPKFVSHSIQFNDFVEMFSFLIFGNKQIGLLLGIEQGILCYYVALRFN